MCTVFFLFFFLWHCFLLAALPVKDATYCNKAGLTMIQKRPVIFKHKQTPASQKSSVCRRYAYHITERTAKLVRLSNKQKKSIKVHTKRQNVTHKTNPQITLHVSFRRKTKIAHNHSPNIAWSTLCCCNASSPDDTYAIVTITHTGIPTHAYWK